MRLLRVLRIEDLERLERDPVDADTLTAAASIVAEVRAGGEAALRRLGVRFGDIDEHGPLVFLRPDLERAKTEIDDADLAVLERTAERIERFARAQRSALNEVDVAVPGGRAGHQLAPVERAGCYAPGGRYPLPSSVLMTAVTARAAGVAEVWLASPRPGPITLAAAAVAGVDAVLAVGGAQAVAALAYGAGPVPACDVVVGPGNRWVTAAKQLVSGRVGIDMLAGPSELVVLADDSADPSLVAADLLAQAEHDPDAMPILVTTSVGLAEAVERELGTQLVDLPTREVARAALLGNGGVVVVADLEQAVAACNHLAPEHLQVLMNDAGKVAEQLSAWGGLFLGAQSAEVLGDYGAGPNHTLPTGGVARFKGGLSVFDFLRVRTWLEINDREAAADLVADAEHLARLEGLEAHARAAARRR